MGGILPQIRGESLVFGETEGELQRERDLGCASENGVSIFGYIFCAGATKCRKIRAASKCASRCIENIYRLSLLFLCVCAIINEGQPPVGSCLG